MKNWLNNNPLTIAFLTVLLSGCSRPHHESATAAWYCPMHPTVTSNAPSVCPVCQMDLVPMDAGGTDAAADASLSGLTQPVSSRVISGVRSIRGTWGRLPVTVKTDGLVITEPGGYINLSATSGGRIEFSALRYDGQPVNKGQELLRIYSPAVLEAQQNFLQLRTPASRERLLRLGMGEGQLSSLEQTGKPVQLLSVYSPADGTLSFAGSANGAIETKSGTGESGGSMGGETETGTVTTTTILTPGMQVVAGQNLVTIRNAGATSLRVTIPATAEQVPKRGDTLTMKQADGTVYSAIVTGHAPETNEGFSTLIASSTGNAPVNGARLNVIVQRPGPEGLWIPRSSAVFTGDRWVVFVAKDGIFEPRTISAGPVSGDQLLVTTGLAANEFIAIQAGMLVDSDQNHEHRLK